MNTSTTTYLASKPRYEILDGLRGVAALIVVAYHLLETYFHGAPQQPINHGYMAVDFFFVLSGFVISYAYDDRWQQMNLRDFFKRRIVRLHPMVVLGSILGALLFYFGDASAFPLVNETEWWKVLLICGIGITMVPVSPSMDIRGWGETYPLNGPQWSLMWEYIANILYAFLFRHLSKGVLALLVVFSALLTLNLALNIDVGGILAARDYAKYSVVGGWSTSADQLLVGASRLLYPFLCGLLMARMGWLIKLKGGFWWSSLIVTIVLCFPHLNGHENALEDGIYQAICILFFLPLIVSIGAGSLVSGTSATLCRWLGRISYPLYITHFPFIYMHMAWADKHSDLPLTTHIFVAVGIFLFSVAVAQAALVLYDEPVRQWLTDHWLKRKPRTRA